MALTLITGGSGSGKTHKIYVSIIEESIRRPADRFFVLVPEQATMQAQKDIVRLHPRHGTMNIDIASFERLAYRVFSELSIPQPEILDDTGKTMVLRRLAGEKKELLPMFSSHLNQTGFIGEVKSMLSEFYQYGVTPKLLKEQINDGGMNRILAGKLSDMTTIYEAFKAFTEANYITMEELLDALCAVVPRSGLLKGATVVLDGYTGFTPVQYRLLGLLLVHCRDVYVTVTVTENGALYEPGTESDLFDMSRKMALRLAALAKENGVSQNPDMICGKRPLWRFSKSPALDYLEKTVFRYPYKPYGHRAGHEEDVRSMDSLRLIQADNPADEVDFAINQIHQLVKIHGFRYREIALICGDLPGYTREITHQFAENAIPIFIDENRDVSGNPLLRLIKGSLEILSGGFDYESMFQYLRSGLVTEKKESVDRLENYVRAMGIRGFKRWSSVWEKSCNSMPGLNIPELNVFREEIMAPLMVWKETAGERGASVAVMTKALTELLETLCVEQKLQERSDAFTALKMDQEAREYAEIYGLVMGLFERLYELLGEETVSKKEYLEIVKAGLSELKVGMIPACADRVVAGDLKRTRLDGIRALFFLGVNEGVVPADTGKGGILTESEREELKKRSLELAPTAREEGFMQRFYLYLTMTKPSELLCLSWSLQSSEGKLMRPSSLIGQMKKRFPAVSVQSSAKEKRPDISISAARKAVLCWLQKPEGIFDEDQEHTCRDLYGWLASKGGCSEEMEELACAASYTYKDAGIGNAAAHVLYGTILNGAVTRMEGYAACAYAHFLNHGLELKKRREYELDLSDMGTLFHQTIDLFFKEVRERGKDFRTISEAERKKLVSWCVAEVSGEYRNTIMKDSARNAYLASKVERITDRTIRALIYQIQKGDFEPAAFEVEVSRKIPLKGRDSLNLRGRIDRMDVFEDDENVYVKIMDYKSGSTSFDLSLLYHGLQLQLVVYMDAALDAEARKHPEKNTVPAGIFYYHIDDPVLERQEDMSPEQVEAGILKKLRMNGLVNSSLEVIRHMDHEIEKESDVIPVALKDGLIQETRSSVAGGKRFARLSGYVTGKLKTMGEEILDGTVTINPYKQGNRTACDYCPFHSVCGFDLKTKGFAFRRFPAMKAEEIWARIDQEEDREEDQATGEEAESHEKTKGIIESGIVGKDKIAEKDEIIGKDKKAEKNKKAEKDKVIRKSEKTGKSEKVRKNGNEIKNGQDVKKEAAENGR